MGRVGGRRRAGGGGGGGLGDGVKCGRGGARSYSTQSWVLTVKLIEKVSVNLHSDSYGRSGHTP